MKEALKDDICDSMYRAQLKDKEHLKTTFAQHNQEILPKERISKLAFGSRGKGSKFGHSVSRAASAPTVKRK